MSSFQTTWNSANYPLYASQLTENKSIALLLLINWLKTFDKKRLILTNYFSWKINYDSKSNLIICNE